jgi:nascent polypeptide-associated complex subunit alpha
MFPGFGGMDPRQMKMMLKQFGIKSEEIHAKRVVFEFEEKKIIIEEPQVTAMDMHGNKIYSVMGKEIEEKAKTEIPESDILMVSEKAKVSREEAFNALKETKGDIAEAIQKLTK